MNKDIQSELAFADEPNRQGPQPVSGTVLYLGLTIDHRSLLRAMADGWLRPQEGNDAQVLGVGKFVRESEPLVSGHRIVVRLYLSTNKLPDLEVPVFRMGKWTTTRLRDLCPEDDAVHWPGAIPTFAITSATVSSAEERSRLIGLTGAASNLDHSEVQITVAGKTNDCTFTSRPHCETRTPLVISPSQDSIHGALTMAVWAVPRIDPWMDVLRSGIAADLSGLVEATAAVDAHWWRFPPWRQASDRPGTLADCLWLAAVDTFQQGDSSRSSRPRDLLARIAERAMQHGREEINLAITAWQENTARILMADATVQLQRWRRNPVGIAIQLVLTRPEPDRFKTWFKDMPNLPPGVAWSAATLCGLLNGYKRLATHFRGCALQRELLSIEALSVCTSQTTELRWPSGRLDLRWRRDGESLVLSHGDQDFARRPQHARGKWYAADFGDARVRRMAESVAQKLNWPCYRVPLDDMDVPVSGSGKLAIRNGHIEALGRMSLHVPRGTFTVESFRRLVAIESGELQAPAIVEAHSKPPSIDIPGLTYRPDFINEEHEQRLIDWIDRQKWSSDLSRRVQHYGWRYDYKARKMDSSMQLGPLPKVLAVLAQRLIHQQLVLEMPDQVIVNEYKAGQGISPHIDATNSFADGVAMISLLESWEMAFHAPGSKGGKRSKVPRLLERRSVAILHGDARWKWKHEIVKRKSDPYVDGTGKQRKRFRKRRISLTFRKVQSSA